MQRVPCLIKSEVLPADLADEVLRALVRQHAGLVGEGRAMRGIPTMVGVTVPEAGHPEELAC
jgi:hypothetical protein